MFILRGGWTVSNSDRQRAFELREAIGKGAFGMVMRGRFRGIDVAVMARDKTRDGQPIEFVQMQSHAHLTYDMLDVWEPDLEGREEPHERIFKRDCLEIDFRIGGKPLTHSLFRKTCFTVGQRDELWPTLTPREQLVFARRLAVALDLAADPTLNVLFEDAWIKFDELHEAIPRVCGDGASGLCHRIFYTLPDILHAKGRAVLDQRDRGHDAVEPAGPSPGTPGNALQQKH